MIVYKVFLNIKLVSCLEGDPIMVLSDLMSCIRLTNLALEPCWLISYTSIEPCFSNPRLTIRMSIFKGIGKSIFPGCG